MGNNSTITIVKPIESFSFYYEIQRTGFVSDKRISVIERIIDFEPDALKYIKIECSQCQFPVAIGFKIGGALEEGNQTFVWQATKSCLAGSVHFG